MALRAGEMRMRMMMLAVAAMMVSGAAGAAERGKPDRLPSKLPTVVPQQVLATPPLTPDNTLLLDLSTGGRVTVQMRPDIAPRHVERIKTLVRQHFYDGTVFHRVIDGFMAQGGDPTGTGTGGSKLPDLKAEFNSLPHVRGAVAMARAGSKDSANSQFYIVLQPTLKLDGNYTVWGRVVDGMDQVDAIEKGEPPANPSKIVHAAIASDGAGAVPPVAAPGVGAAVPGSAAAVPTAPIVPVPRLAAPAAPPPPMAPSTAMPK